MITEDTKKVYELRYHRFVPELTVVSKMNPKEEFLYRIMDGVPFKDLVTALMMAKMDYDERTADLANDNKNS